MKILKIDGLLVTNPDFNDESTRHLRNEESLREALKNTVRALCGSRLKDTDWYSSRFIETGVEIPAEIKAARLAIRDWCNAKEVELDTLTYAELKAYDATA